jgi:hypothetical protein
MIISVSGAVAETAPTALTLSTASSPIVRSGFACAPIARAAARSCPSAIPPAATTASITGDVNDLRNKNHRVRVAATAACLGALGDDHVDTETNWVKCLPDVHHLLHPQRTGVMGWLY